MVGKKGIINRHKLFKILLGFSVGFLFGFGVVVFFFFNIR